MCPRRTACSARRTSRPLDPDVVDQLIKRTEGWAALLMLVRTSLEDKAAPEARALVAQLSAARGDLYDFLAEEVLASLSPTLTHFLTRVSVLVSVDPETGALVVDRPASEVAGLIGEAEALGLLSRPDREAPHRFHPLVRDFLAAHLASEIGSAAVRDLHLRVAQALEPTDWFGSAWHYRAAGQPDDAARVIDAALPNILALGTVELSSRIPRRHQLGIEADPRRWSFGPDWNCRETTRCAPGTLPKKQPRSADGSATGSGTS